MDSQRWERSGGDISEVGSNDRRNEHRHGDDTQKEGERESREDDIGCEGRFNRWKK